CTGTSPTCSFTAAAGQSITATFEPSPIAITSALTASAAVGSNFRYVLTAVGTAPISLGVSGLPAGLSFDASPAEITGTAPSAGPYNILLSASDASGSDNKTLVLTTGVPPTITSSLTY